MENGMRSSPRIRKEFFKNLKMLIMAENKNLNKKQKLLPLI